MNNNKFLELAALVTNTKEYTSTLVSLSELELEQIDIMFCQFLENKNNNFSQEDLDLLKVFYIKLFGEIDEEYEYLFIAKNEVLTEDKKELISRKDLMKLCSQENCCDCDNCLFYDSDSCYESLIEFANNYNYKIN